jgi:hypothetical protein
MMGTIAEVFPVVYSDVKSFHLRFGLECHFKNPADQFFSTLNGLLDEGSLAQTFSAVKPTVEFFQREWDKKVAADPTRIPATFIAFRAPKKDKVKMRSMVSSSLPCLISKCHRWSFTRNDKRRKRMLGHNGALTGVDVRAWAHEANGKVSLIGGTFHRCKTAAPAVEEVELEECDAGNAEGQLEEPILGSKRRVVADGWRISYRSRAPEDEGGDVAAARIEAKMNGSHDNPFLEEGRRHCSAVEKIQWRESKVVRMRLRTDAQKRAGLEAHY